MIKTIFPSKDATLFQASESMNTGYDEILEISKHISSSFGALAVTRPIIQFDFSTVSASLSAQAIHTSSDSGNLKYFFKAFASEEVDVPAEYKLSLHILTEGWVMGSGRSTHNPITTNGARWKYTGMGGHDMWNSIGGSHSTASAASAEQSFANVSGDIEIDITTIVENWNNGTRVNNGLILKRSGSQESDSTEYGSLYYYSKNTHTIYSPRIEARYDDASHTISGVSGSEATLTDEINIEPRLQPTYKQGTVERIFVDVHKKFGARSQAGVVGFPHTHYLPPSSSYAVIDNATGEYVYKHDQVATYVGRTGTAQNYFDFDTAGLFPDRYYGIEIKVNHYDGTNVIATRYYQPSVYFKVVK